MNTRSAKMKILSVLAASAGALICSGAPAQAVVNLVQNPGFETGDTSGWNVTPFATSWFATSGIGGGNPTPPPGGGAFFASSGCEASFVCDLSQTLSTTAGTKYTLSFEFNPGQLANLNPSHTVVYWDGTEVQDFAGGLKGWKSYTFTGLVGTGSDTLTFQAFDQHNWNGIDNVFVGASGPVPGAGVAGLAALALAGLYARARRA